LLRAPEPTSLHRESFGAASVPGQIDALDWRTKEARKPGPQPPSSLTVESPTSTILIGWPRSRQGDGGREEECGQNARHFDVNSSAIIVYDEAHANHSILLAAAAAFSAETTTPLDNDQVKVLKVTQDRT